MSRIIAFMSLLLLAVAVQAGEYAPQKAVYHVNYDATPRQLATLRNIGNHLDAVGDDNMDLRVVIHGAGISLLRQAVDNPDLQSRIDGLRLRGVKFNVCANTLRGRGLSVDDLHDTSEDDLVPSGVAEVAHLQAQGFAYLHP